MRSRVNIVGLVTLLAVSRIAFGQPTVRTITLPAPNATLPEEFTQVSSVRELADGRLLVVDLLERTLKVVDWSTRTATPIGRNGSGPGEYQQPTTLLSIGGDSSLLPDQRNGRWLLLHGAEIVGSIGPDAPAMQSGTRAPVGADGRGNLIALKAIATGSVSPANMPRRDSLMLLRIARGNGAADTVARLRARASVIRVEGPASQPTSVSVLTNPLATGEAAVLFGDGWIAIARDPYRIEWIAPDGRRVLGPELPFVRIRLDEREQRAFLQRESQRTGRPPRDPSALPEWPDFMPPFRDPLLLAPDGRLWVRRLPTTADLNPPYDVIDRRGVLVSRVAVEKGVHVAGVGRNVVYTIVTDDSGIQRIERRSLPVF